jgi:hypothetical protein
MSDFRPLLVEHARLLDEVLERHDAYRRHPLKIFPWLLRPCRVRVLLVTDGGLDFSDQDFGLSTFVTTLVNDTFHYVEFELTLAHLRSNVTDAQVMVGAPGIARSIKNFRFDEPSHFAVDMYDQVWLFGIETFFHSTSYDHRNNNKGTYPPDRLGNVELSALSAFMNAGGGLFATGDHGLLGRNLGGSVTRARSMRLWGPTSPNLSLDEVSMGGPRRNDTNRIGHDPGSQFDDQSDDVPQEIQPRLYSAQLSPFFHITYPHPLLCGPKGVIDVLPDHPHEGECVEPSNLGATYPFDGTPEYPPAIGGGTLAPEVIARSSVPAGNDSDGSKLATVAHSFGAISAYDGHRAGIGRVVCDATWHHFVNINLVGEISEPETSVKGRGFLASAAGEAHLAKIRAYYRNIAVWISPPLSHRCFTRKLIWALLYQHRVLEAVVATPQLELERTDVSLLFEIGIHARDVLGRTASRCQTLRWVLDLVLEELPELIPEIDPWVPPRPEPDPPFPPFVDPTPLVDIALGGALLALREEFPMPSVEIRDDVDKRADELIRRGVAIGLQRGTESLDKTLSRYSGRFRTG